MTRGFIQAEIDKLKGDKQYTTKFTSEFVREKDAPPPPAKSTRSAKQSAPSTSSSAKRPVIKKKGRQALLDLPEDNPDLIGRGLAIASHFNMYDFNSLLKVNKHIFQNGQ